MFGKDKTTENVIGCPLNNFKPCQKHACAWYTQIRGTNPNTGQEIDNWGCAIAWMPLLLLEGAKETRQGAAAIESFRNEMVTQNERSLTLQQMAIEREKLSKHPQIKEVHSVYPRIVDGRVELDEEE